MLPTWMAGLCTMLSSVVIVPLLLVWGGFAEGLTRERREVVQECNCKCEVEERAEDFCGEDKITGKRKTFGSVCHMDCDSCMSADHDWKAVDRHLCGSHHHHHHSSERFDSSEEDQRVIRTDHELDSDEYVGRCLRERNFSSKPPHKCVRSRCNCGPNGMKHCARGPHQERVIFGNECQLNCANQCLEGYTDYVHKYRVMDMDCCQ